MAPSCAGPSTSPQRPGSPEQTNSEWGQLAIGDIGYQVERPRKPLGKAVRPQRGEMGGNLYNIRRQSQFHLPQAIATRIRVW